MSFVVNILFAENEKWEMKQSYILKHTFNCGNKWILWVITDSENSTIQLLKSFLLRGITSKNYGDWYGINCLHSFYDYYLILKESVVEC